MLNKLVFDTTDANTIADSHHVGAHTLAGDGTLISSKLIDSANWLNAAAAMFASDGVGITQTAGALDVNLKSPITVDTQLEGIYNAGTNANPDNTGVIFHTRNASPADAQQVERTTAGAATSDAVVAATVHGQDVISYGMVYNGTTFDRLTGTSGAMNIADGGNVISVDDAGGSLTVDGAVSILGDVNVTQGTSPWVVSDAALANAAIKAKAASLDAADTAQPAIAGGDVLANRKYVWLLNNDNRVMYIGEAAVTEADGYPIDPGTEIQMRAGAAVDIGFISAKLNHKIRTLQLS